MGLKNQGAIGHPSRVSERAKLAAKRAYDAEQEKKKYRDDFKPLDLKKQDWSAI